MKTVVIILIFLLITAGVVRMQIFLSGRKNKLFGLILPLVAFMASLMAAGSIVVYTNIGITSQSVSEEGKIISQKIEDTRDDFPATAAGAVTVFLLANIPTAVLVGIYSVCREKIHSRSEIEKMRAEDLE